MGTERLDAETKDNALIQYVSMEAERCYVEIARRSTEQFRAVATAILTLGTVVGLVSKFTDNLIDLLAVIPWIHSILGYIWLDHSAAIFRTGEYLRKTVEPLISEISGRELGYVNFVSKTRVQSRTLGKHSSPISFYFPLFYFILPSVFSVVSYFIYHIRRHQEPDLFSLGVVLLSAVFIVFLVRHWLGTNQYVRDVISAE